MPAGRPGDPSRPCDGRRFLLPCSALAALLSIVGTARADEAGAEVELDVVEVRGDAPAPPPEPTVRQEPTGFGTVIELREFAGERRQVSELLLEAPGTRVHHAPGGATLMLRGGSSDQSLVFLDGIPLNAAAGGGVDLRTIPASLLERITVLRGNEGARYGAGALGGVALLESRALRAGMGGAASLSAGSFGTWQLEGAGWGGGDSANGLAALTLRRSSGDYSAIHDPTPRFDPSDARRETVTNNDEASAGLLLKGGVQMGEARVHGLVHGWLAERGMAGTFSTPDDHRRDERRVLAAVRAEGAAAPALQLDGGVEWRHDEVAVWSEAARGIHAQPPTDAPGKPWQVENALTVRMGAESAPVDWTLLRADVAVGNEWLDSPYHGVRSRERVGLSVSDELYLGNAITVVPAARWDRVDQYEGFSPRLGVAVRPWAPLELRSNWGRTFRVPSLGELYLEQGRVKANPNLRPERGWTVDGGAVIRLPGTLLQLTAFYARTSDLILYEMQSAGISRPLNFHDVEVGGGEVELVVRPVRWLTLSGAWSLARTRNLRDDPRYFGKELPHRPRERIHGRAAVREGDFEAFATGAHQSAQWLNRTHTNQLPAYTTFGAGAGWRLATAPWTVWLSGQVDNAFDALRIDQLGFPQPGRAFTVTLRALSPEG